jgi:predicted peptidase
MKRASSRWLSHSLFFVWLLLSTGSVLGAETGFLNRRVEIGGEAYRYQVFVPANWTPQEKWPVVLFLHGAGERGEDGILQTEVGIGTAIRRTVDRFPAIIVMPQCRKGVWWTDPRMETVVFQALDQSIREFGGDPDRTYLAGLSMGGYGTWAFAAKHPGRFAALTVICGGVRRPSRAPAPESPEVEGDPYLAVARQVGKTPTWIFHGADDRVVPPDESRKMHQALTSVDGVVRYTEYEGVGHASWEKAFAEPELMTWMLSQRRAVAK